jgi:hypothetical protein
MGTVVSYFEHSRRARPGRLRHADPVLVGILEALLVLGGQAHRQAVADQVAFRRTGRFGPADAAERDEIYDAFDRYLAGTTTGRAQRLLWLPLGPGSYRWALTDASLRLLQPTSPDMRLVR